MPALNTISPDKLARLVALPGAPSLIDLRADPSTAIPGSVFRSPADPSGWPAINATSVVTVDAKGEGHAVAAAAFLRSEGMVAEVVIFFQFFD